MMDEIIALDKIIRTALAEDIRNGDITTAAIVDRGQQGEAILLARERIMLAGISVFGRVFQVLSEDTTFEYYYQDGQEVPAGATVCLLKGAVDAILKGERTALNFLQRMSGIATLTRQYVEEAASGKIRVVDTRKTAPGLRMLDKYSVRMGGGHNHRFGLYDGILIKDNHIVAAGSISRAIVLARNSAPHTIKVEVEVEDLAGVKEALKAGADIILLDNMSPDLMKEAVQLVNGRALVEASGGIHLENIHAVAQTGVDIISVGALTHSPRAADFSLELKPL